MAYFNRILNNCREVSEILVSDEPISAKHRLETLLHVAFCKCCKNFEVQTKNIDTALKHISTSLEDEYLVKASAVFKDKIKEKLQ